MSHRTRRHIPGAPAPASPKLREGGSSPVTSPPPLEAPASTPARARGLQLAGEDPPSRNFGEAGASAPGKLAAASGSVAISEFLILFDGTVLAHNLTPVMADVLLTLAPDDPAMSRRARRCRLQRVR